jgi:hypothetical protein
MSNEMKTILPNSVRKENFLHQWSRFFPILLCSINRIACLAVRRHRLVGSISS